MANQKAIIINYDEVTIMLHERFGISRAFINKDIRNVLTSILASYICTGMYDSLYVRDVLSKLCKRNMSDEEFIRLIYDINEVILRITSTYLPGFRPYSKWHTLPNECIKFSNESSAVIIFTESQFNEYTRMA